MDPNANLTEQRRLIAKLSDPLSPLYDEQDRQADLGRIVDLAQTLDQWISKGGFLPDAWNPRKAGRCTTVSTLNKCRCTQDAGHDGPHVWF